MSFLFCLLQLQTWLSWKSDQKTMQPLLHSSSFCITHSLAVTCSDLFETEELLKGCFVFSRSLFSPAEERLWLHTAGSEQFNALSHRAEDTMSSIHQHSLLPLRLWPLLICFALEGWNGVCVHVYLCMCVCLKKNHLCKRRRTERLTENLFARWVSAWRTFFSHCCI